MGGCRAASHFSRPHCPDPSVRFVRSPDCRGGAMSDSDRFPPDSSRIFTAHSSRRDFLKLSALGAIAGVVSPAMAQGLFQPGRQRGIDRGNAMPGRIVMLREPEMDGHLSTIDKERVAEVVHAGIRILTGVDDTAAAFESLFPGLHSGSTFAIKVNCLGITDTRWEVVRGIVSGLAAMLGGTYDVSQVVIYDRHNLHSHGYDESEFTFNGNTPLISHTNNASGSGYYVWENHQLSQYILDCDYLINVPALKCHNNGNNQITIALKNHYGSCDPASLCGDIPGMLAVNADSNVKVKTNLVVTSALRGTYWGGPGDYWQEWNLYPELTPNSIFFSTDPVTNEYWARDLINAQRIAMGYSEKPCPWVEDASEPPYELGISDPDQMTVINLDAAGVVDDAGRLSGGTFFTANVPNPFAESTTLRFRLERGGPVSLRILDAAGRSVRDLGTRWYAAGRNAAAWNGRDAKARRVAAGVYFAHLQAGSISRTRRIIVAR
ncbi:MAG: DUF362 domain-containing protein [Candidatus Eisenbacteria bacterium]|nr:DUF362 domain-containing protein [Candidatus Eisenbacteria bacterium]